MLQACSNVNRQKIRRNGTCLCCPVNLFEAKYECEECANERSRKKEKGFFFQKMMPIDKKACGSFEVYKFI